MSYRTLLQNINMALLLLACSACAPVPEKPLSSGLVRINLDADVGNEVRAYRVDGELTPSIRFGDLTPGTHSLQVRYHFEVPGGSATGGLLEGNYRTCILEITYDGFIAGNQYLLKAERRGWRPAAWLYDQQTQEKVATAKEVRCGPGV
ncbi:MAG: hypothetical protein V7756_17035 [Halopseudomonas sp.]|uniref:PA0061/PA0062 family lipoprotein n=1 Tax=Halopseudomonas sp. TaxID=2901191 RepID=UPI0030012CD7